MLERYRPQNTLRDRTRRKQIDFLQKRPDYSALYEAISKGEELRRNQEIVNSATQDDLTLRPEKVVETVQDQFAPNPNTGLPEAGKNFGPVTEPKKRGFFKNATDFLSDKFQDLEDTGKFIGELIFSKRENTGISTPVDVLTDLTENAPFFKEFNKRQKELTPKYTEAGINPKDVLLDLIPHLTDSKVGRESGAFEKFQEIQKETPGDVIPGSGKQLGSALATSLPSALSVKKFVTGSMAIPDYKPENVTGIVFDPLNAIDIGLGKIITTPVKIASKYGAKTVAKQTLARTGSDTRAFTDIKDILNPDEFNDVINISSVRASGISENLLPNQVFDADFDIYARMGMAVPRSATGISRSTLFDITRKLEDNVVNANDYLQARKGIDKALPGHSATDFTVPFTTKILNLDQQEELLKQLNNFWKTDTLTREGVDARRSFDFENAASRLKPNEEHLQSRLTLNDLFKDKTNNPFSRIGDALIGRRAAYKGGRFTTPFKLTRIFTGYRAQRPYLDDMQDIVSGKMEGNVNYYLEGINHYYDSKIRITPQIIERDILKLKNTGSPILTNENGISKIRDMEVTPKLLLDIGIKPVTDADGKVVLPTAEFLGRFFTKETPYWKLTGAENVDVAKNTSLGKWVETYQNIIKQSVERNKNLGGAFAANNLENIGEFIPRISRELNEITVNPQNYDYTKARIFTDDQAVNAVAEGYIKYHEDPYNTLRIFLASQESAALQAEYKTLVEKVARSQFTDSVVTKSKAAINNIVKAGNDIVTDLEPAANKILEKRQISRIRFNFPELGKDFNDLAGMTGKRYENKLADIQKKVLKLKESPTSQFNINLRRQQDSLANYEKNYDQWGIKVSDRELIIKEASRKNLNKIKVNMGAKGEEVTGLLKVLSSVGRGAENFSGMYQFVGAGFDIGSPLVHGIVPLVTNPKGWAKGVQIMFNSIMDPEMKVFNKYLENNVETLELANKLNIPLGAQTSDWLQVFQSGRFYKGGDSQGRKWLGRNVAKIPKIGPAIADAPRKLLGGAERAFASPIDIMKLEMLKTFRPLAKTNNDLDEIASLIKHSTGAMDLYAMGMGRAQRTVEALLFFSPRLLRGSAALLADAAQGGIKGQLARESIARLLMVNGFMAHLISRITGGETSYDPTNSRFGMVKIGETWIGSNRSVQSLSQVLIAMTEDIALGDVDAPYIFKGKTKDEFGNTIYNPLYRWQENKSAYGRQLAMQILTGEDYWGQEKNLFAGEGLDVLIPLPLWMQSAQLEDANRGVREADISIPVFGDLDFYWGQLVEPLGGRSFKEGIYEQRERTRNRIASEIFGPETEWKDLTAVQQSAIENPPVEFLNGLSEIDKEKYENNKTELDQFDKAWQETFKNKADSELLSQFFGDQKAEKDILRNQIERETKRYESGEFGIFSDFRKRITSLEHDYYARLDVLENKYAQDYPEFDVSQQLMDRARRYPEDSYEFLYSFYSKEVSNNPDFDLPGGEYDYEGHQRADRQFFDEYGQDVYAQVKLMQYLRKDQNIYTSEIINGKDIFGGLYWASTSQQIRQLDPITYDFYINTYQKAADYEQEAMLATNPQLKSLIDTRNQVRKLLRESNPLLDIWVYRNGYGRETLYSKAFADSTGKPDPKELNRWSSLDTEVDWSDLYKRRKQLFPEYY